MVIKSIKLSNFRNFIKKDIELSDGATVIVGDNAVGKTNILEAIYLLAMGKSFKARLERELINYDVDIARIKGSTRSKSITGTTGMELEIVLTNGEVELHGGGVQRAQKKKLSVNGVSKRLIDFTGCLKVVLFGPWDMDLVTASPSLRRRFLDSVLSQTDREYRRSLMIYEKGLRQRNRLLFRIRDEGVSRGQLMYWDRLLIKHGQYITQMRGEFIGYCNSNNGIMGYGLWGMGIDELKNEEIKINTNSKLPISNYQIEYDMSVISEGRLEQYKNEEVAAGMTLVGPHRDDFIIEITSNKKEIKKLRNKEINKEERNLAIFGSRGEQRMGVLWLKLAELSYIESVTHDKPILLLDDIFSELDHEHREIVMGVCNNQQTIITTADPHNVEGLTGIKKINIRR
ncbi:MAG: replication and repair protein RecF protein [Candidatus Woesebacteria bacterium GW2011_GWC1_38_13]|uniref:DNA replication and repair protein RecF n=2 Tax=Candidatus Woeseibacteriota TaxID=1752722 RepID=A0A0G0L0U2_9BACT|nr:MAG: replication and repair protein RecF protein [Candidatus Woesebacteria bacterium GW2011_GWC1_38_13]